MSPGGRMRADLITLTFFVLAASAAHAQQKPAAVAAPVTAPVTMPVTVAFSEQRSLTAKSGRAYGLKVALPDDYAADTRAYPVLYVLDGWHFPLVAYIQDNSRYAGRMPAVISVTIDQGDDAVNLRARDFTPTHVADEPPSGGADAFLDFLEHELIPYIDRTYRTVPGDRGLLGHSYGGLFAIYALEQRPALFQHIVAASPTMDWDNDLLIRQAAERLKSLPAPVRLDLSAGDAGDTLTSTSAFAEELRHLHPANLTTRFTAYHGENHTSVRVVSFPAGLSWVYGK